MRGRRGVRAQTLRLSRQGETVAYHLEPKANRFKPGSVLYFVSEGASANPYGGAAVYELEVVRSGEAGEAMVSVSAAPRGEPKPVYWHRAEWEEDRYYQAALVDAPDLWLWDFLFAPEVKSYPIEVSALAPSASEGSKLSVWLQGVSDFPADPVPGAFDHLSLTGRSCLEAQIVAAVRGGLSGAPTLTPKRRQKTSNRNPASSIRFEAGRR